MTEQNNEEVQEISLEELEQLMEGSESADDKLPPIVIDLEEYDLKEFQRGIKETSYLVGQVTALLNAGLSESGVLDLLSSKDAIAHNLEVANINKATSIEVSKNQRLMADKHEL